MKSNLQLSLITLLLLAAASAIFAQENLPPLNFEIERRSINQTGMLVLGGWAAANIISGSIGYFSAKKSNKYFHQFNAAWNTVNLTIAIFGYIQSTAPIPENFTSIDIIKEFQFMQNLFLLNAGLDAAYIMTGLYLNEKSKSSIKNKNRLKGYASSLFLQGGFLLIFDIIKYFIHQNNAEINLFPTLNIAESSVQFNLLLQF
jgi:hypothetical protein